MTATSLDTSEKAGRFVGLEGYRGIAAMGIVVYHVYQHIEKNSEGSLGQRGDATYTVLHGLDGAVSLFFVLSAFLLTLPFITKALNQNDAPSARSFLSRRAARVLPLYFVAILLVWAARNINLPGTLIDLVEHLTFTQVYDNRYIFYTIGPAWSLAIEIQFYIVLAVLGTWGVRIAKGRSRRWVIVTTGAFLSLVAIASFAWKMAAWLTLDVAGDDWKVWFGFPAKADEFALGALLALVVAARSPQLSRWKATAMALLGLGIVAIALATRPGGAGEHAAFHTINAVGFTLIIAASVMSPKVVMNRALNWGPVALVGTVSYSLYLWHEPLMILLDNRGLLPAGGGYLAFAWGLAVVLPLAVGVAWVSYQAIERPGLGLRGLVDRYGRSRDYYDGS